jgi:hypothetical protein
MAKPRTSHRSGGIEARLVARAKTILEGEGLAAAAPAVLPRVKPSIELVPGRRVARPMGVGKTRIGGEPDLPPTVAWPVDREKRPLSFLLQVALADLPMLGPLPPNGLLSFFYDTLNLPDGAEAMAGKSCRTLHLDAKQCKTLSRRPAPDSEDGPLADTFEELLLKAKVVPSFPDDLDLLDDDAARGDYLGAIVNPDRSVFKLLGHPNTIQAPMQMKCAMLARGLEPEAAPRAPAMAVKLRREAEQWLLLLQVDSSREMNLQWGDSGRLYFWIRRADLEERKFELVVLLLQSH